MRKLILILFIFSQVFIVKSQQWIPDTNKKFELWMGGVQFGSCLLSVGDTLYLGGHFLKVGNVNISTIARYFNSQWHSLDGGLDSYPQALLYNYNDNNLYVSGTFLQADGKPGTRGLARWDGNNWWAIGSGVNCPGCYGTMEYYDNKVFFSGSNLPGPATGVVAWDGTNWVDKNSLPPMVKLINYNNELFASGPPGNFIKYEGNTSWSWNPFGGCSYYWKMEKDTINDFLYVAGDFAYVCTNPPLVSYGIAMWDGFEWHSFGTNVVSGIGALKVYNGYLYAVHSSDTLRDGVQINYIARWDWDNFSWYAMGTGVNQVPNAFEEFHDTLFVTGDFTTAGGDSAYGLARWYMPDTNCAFLQPTIHTLALQDTFYLGAGLVNVQFFNNNAYAQTWQWNFGDNGTGNTQNPIHGYTNDSLYTITVTVTEDGCTKTDTAKIWVLNGNGTNEYTSESLHFKVYPNPTGGDFTIECTLPQNKTGKVIAYRGTGSQLGEHTLESGSNNFTMPSSNWKDSVILVGVYIDGRQVLVEKVVKK